MAWSPNTLVIKQKSIKMLNLPQSFLPKLARKSINLRNLDVWLSASLLDPSMEMGQPFQFGARLDGMKERTA